MLFTRAGLEIGVAATKTFVCQVAVMYLLALRLAELRGTLSPSGSPSWWSSSSACRTASTSCSRSCRGARRARSRRPAGRPSSSSISAATSGLPVALEGALKLKEISYIATDAYAAGEMKHGPIALLDEATPVVCVATDSPVLEKLVSNIQEVARARGARDRRRPPRATASIVAARRCDDRGARDRLDAAADARRDPPAAARL